MKFEIEETTTTTVIKYIEAENATEAEEKSNDPSAVMKKSEKVTKDIRMPVPTPIVRNPAADNLPQKRPPLNLLPPRKN